MAVECFEQLFEHNAHYLDLKTWCVCRAACNTIECHCRNRKIYQTKIDVSRKLEEAREIAQQIISPKPWSRDDPRCSSRYCCNMTGTWTPPSFVLYDEIPWWKNRQAVRHCYISTWPQEQLPCVSDVRKAISVYVVCSESCLYDIIQALETIHWRKESFFETFLGVDQVPYHSESSDEDWPRDIVLV